MSTSNGNATSGPVSPAVYNPPSFKPADLRGILKYVPRFQGHIFVIAVDGSIVADENFGNLLVDIAVLRSLGIKVVLVHGIGRQMKELSESRRITISNTDGTGVTDAATLDLAIRASARVSQLIMEGLTQNSLKCAITNAVRAVPVGILRGVDQQFTGKLDRLDKDFVDHLLGAAILPILQPIGYGPDGRPYRINSDLLAAGVAEALGASKIIYLMPHAGLEINGEIRREISVESLRQILGAQSGQIAESGRSKAIHAIQAISSGVPRVHIVDGRAYDGLINEIFSNEGVGTLIYGNEYQQIRQARKSDTRFIWSLTRAAVRREELLCRTQQAIEKNIDRFFVYEIDENIIACVTLYFYPDTKTGAPSVAEIGSLYVMPFYQNRSVGRKLVDYACLRAKEHGVRTIVALSTQSYSFFTSVMGFEEADKSILPEARLKIYEDNGRNARILLKEL